MRNKSALVAIFAIVFLLGGLTAISTVSAATPVDCDQVSVQFDVVPSSVTNLTDTITFQVRTMLTSSTGQLCDKNSTVSKGHDYIAQIKMAPETEVAVRDSGLVSGSLQDAPPGVKFDFDISTTLAQLGITAQSISSSGNPNFFIRIFDGLVDNRFLKTESAHITVSLAAAASSQVPAPAISPTGGTFSSGQPVQVILTSAMAGAEIRYTTDGSDPTSASTLYSAPFPLTATTVVKAKAFKAGLTDSPITTATFTIGGTPPPPPAGTPALSPTGFIAECQSGGSIGACIKGIYLLSIGLAALIALLMIVLAGYRYMTASGNAQQVENAKESFTAAVIGLIVIFIAFILLDLINPNLTHFTDLSSEIPPIPATEHSTSSGSGVAGSTCTADANCSSGLVCQKNSAGTGCQCASGSSGSGNCGAP